MSSDLQTTEAKPRGLRAWLGRDDVQEELCSAIGDVMRPDQFAAHMLVAFEDDKVKPCSDASKFKAIHDCAVLGLLPTLQQVALIPRDITHRDENNRPYKVLEVSAMPQWQGWKAVMERHPAILEVSAYLVHTMDGFKFVDGIVHHTYDPLDENRTFKSFSDLHGGYCTITYRDGRAPKYHVVTASYIQKCAACAQTSKIWNAWLEQMLLKTLYRDCYARRAVPVDPLVGAKMEHVMRLDDVALQNDPRRAMLGAQAGESQVKRLFAPPVPEGPADAPPPSEKEPPAPETQEAKGAPPETEGAGNVLDAWRPIVDSCGSTADVKQARKYLDEDTTLTPEQKAEVVKWLDAAAKKHGAGRSRGKAGKLPGMEG